MKNFSFTSNLYRSGKVEQIARQVKTSLEEQNAVAEIKRCIAKGVPLNTPEFPIGYWRSSDDVTLDFKLTTEEDDNGLEAGGYAVIRIYSADNYLKDHYVDIDNPDIDYDIAEIVLSTIEFLLDHGKKKAYTADSGPEL